MDAGLASGTAELEPVGVPGDSDWVSVPGVAVLGVWESEPGEPVLGVWDSEPGEPVLGVWDWSRVSRRSEFGTRSRSGRSQEKRASLPEQQRLASGNVSGKLIGACTNPPSAPKRGNKSARKWDARVRD